MPPVWIVLNRIACSDVVTPKHVVGERWNTWSNIFYVIFGLVGMAKIRRRIPSPTRKYVTGGDIFLLYLWLVVVGLCSFLYHAVHSIWVLGVDLVAILIFTYLTVFFLVQHEPYFAPNLWFALIIVLSSLCLVSSGLQWYYTGMWSYYLTVGIMGSVTVYRLVFSPRGPHRSNIPPSVIAPVREKERREFRSWTRFAMLTFGAAAITYIVPKFWCMDYVDTSIGPLLQLHAYWHLLSSCGLYALIWAMSLFPR